jgi:hypothetical protein
MIDACVVGRERVGGRVAVVLLLACVVWWGLAESRKDNGRFSRAQMGACRLIGIFRRDGRRSDARQG